MMVSFPSWPLKGGLILFLVVLVALPPGTYNLHVSWEHFQIFALHYLNDDAHGTAEAGPCQTLPP